MKTINIIGLVGSGGIAIAFIPQTYKTITSDTLQSTSFLMIFLTFSSSLCMLVYSVYYTIVPMIIANTSVCINTLITMIAFLYKKHNSSIQ
tara:strand:+ start:163 stop:435 length:273 start_codon:yes stop_codon:yes gene_type:complete